MTDDEAQIHSPSYRLAAEDTDFLLRDELRGVRFGLEYQKAELYLRDWGVRSTIIVYGSARTPSPEKAEALRTSGDLGERALERLERQVGYYEAARAFGHIASQRGGAVAHKHRRDNVIATGGGPGVMEAANRGAYEAGAPTIGFNIKLPREQFPNPYTTPELTFQFHYFAMRKMHMAMRANALMAFPGGFGTFEELFELLTLQQTHKAPPAPVVLYDEGWWRRAVNFDMLIDEGVISEGDMKLISFADSPEDAWAAMAARGLKAHGASEATST